MISAATSKVRRLTYSTHSPLTLTFTNTRHTLTLLPVSNLGNYNFQPADFGVITSLRSMASSSLSIPRTSSDSPNPRPSSIPYFPSRSFPRFLSLFWATKSTRWAQSARRSSGIIWDCTKPPAKSDTHYFMPPLVDRSSLLQGKVPLKDIRPIEIFMCSVVQRQGYGEGVLHNQILSAPVLTLVIQLGFRWLSQYVSQLVRTLPFTC